MLFLLLGCLLLTMVPALAQGPTVCLPEGLNVTLARTLVSIGLTNVDVEYPNGLALTLFDDGDARPPRQLHPAFFGCYDWHSAVHTHWQLLRIARVYPQEPFVDPIRAVLADHLTADKIAIEAAYMTTPGREGFERPYGLAWLLQLVAELVEWDDPQGNGWREVLKPVEQAAVASLSTWLPKLTHPIRVGEHSQTAFAFGLVIDYARTVNNSELEALLVERSIAFYASDYACPLNYEPSGHDFLSPCIAEADLMRRVLSAPDYSSVQISFFIFYLNFLILQWLDQALPNLPRGPDYDPNWLVPVKPADYVRSF